METKLEGLFFLSYEENDNKRDLIWQGFVESNLGGGSYLLQLFSWIDGEPSVKKVRYLRELGDFDFYHSIDDMKKAIGGYRSFNPTNK